MYCSNCGTRLANSSTLCYNCGRTVDAASCPDQPILKVKPLVDLDRSEPEEVSSKNLVVLEKLERKPLNKKLFAIGGIVIALLIACGIGAGFLSNEFFGPNAFVTEYFNAIADGDIAKASSMTEPAVASEGVIGVLKGALDDEENRISDISVGEIGKDGSVDVSYSIDDRLFSSNVSVKDCTPNLPFFKRYAISSSAEVAVPISNSGPNRMMLNGVEFELPSLPNDGYPVKLMCLPGRYTLTAPESDLYSCGEMEFTISSAIETEATDSGSGYFLEIEFADSLVQAASDSVNAYVNSCLEQDEQGMSGAPFRPRLTSNAEFKGWSGVREKPRIKPLEGEIRNNTSSQRIKGGSVLYATTAGGSIGYDYSYTLPSGKKYERTGSARIQNMDIYLDLRSGAIDIAFDGKAVYGDMLEVEGDLEIVLEDLIADLDSAEAFEDIRAGL